MLIQQHISGSLLSAKCVKIIDKLLNFRFFFFDDFTLFFNFQNALMCNFFKMLDMIFKVICVQFDVFQMLMQLTLQRHRLLTFSFRYRLKSNQLTKAGKYIV
ncbi:hypothetical protein AAY84_06635 [Serratia marcescens]|nr:hypothetical protein AAY84_06635 [Serratia marcescens]